MFQPHDEDPDEVDLKAVVPKREGPKHAPSEGAVAMEVDEKKQRVDHAQVMKEAHEFELDLDLDIDGKRTYRCVVCGSNPLQNRNRFLCQNLVLRTRGEFQKLIKPWRCPRHC